MKQFDSHIIGELNETYEHFVFNEHDQLPDESFDECLVALPLTDWAQNAHSLTVQRGQNAHYVPSL